MNKIIAENIRTIREMRNLTRDFVACEMDMSTSGYGKIERGEIDLTISKISRIAFIFGISISDLIFFDVNSFFNNDRNKKTESNANYLHSSKVKVMNMSGNEFKHNFDIQDKKLKTNDL